MFTYPGSKRLAKGRTRKVLCLPSLRNRDSLGSRSQSLSPSASARLPLSLVAEEEGGRGERQPPNLFNLHDCSHSAPLTYNPAILPPPAALQSAPHSFAFSIPHTHTLQLFIFGLHCIVNFLSSGTPSIPVFPCFVSLGPGS